MTPKPKKRRTVLYRDGLVFITVMFVIFLGALIRQVNLLLLFASILACFLVFDFWLGRRLLRGVVVQRLSHVSPRAGESFLIPISLTNRKKRGNVWGMVVEDTVTPKRNGGWAKESYRPACYFEEVKRGEEVKKSWAGRLPVRGRYSLGPVTISTRFPLGFFRSSVTFDLPGELVVTPKLGRISRDWLARHREKNGERSRFVSRASRVGDETAGVREWQPGDARKSIHWRATAKYRKILVRQFQEREDQAAVVLLDLFSDGKGNGSSGNGGADWVDRENRELAVSFAATLWMSLSKLKGGRLYFGLIAETGAGEPLTDLFRFSSTFPASAMMEILAVAEPTRQDGMETILKKILAANDHGVNLVLVSPEPVDLTAPDRVGDLPNDPRFRQLVRRVVPVVSGSKEFDDIFRIDESPSN